LKISSSHVYSDYMFISIGQLFVKHEFRRSNDWTKDFEFADNKMTGFTVSAFDWKFSVLTKKFFSVSMKNFSKKNVFARFFVDIVFYLPLYIDLTIVLPHLVMWSYLLINVHIFLTLFTCMIVCCWDTVLTYCRFFC